MNEYLDGKLYYGGNAEKRSVAKRVEFLSRLNRKTATEKLKKNVNGCLSFGKKVRFLF